MNREDIIGMMEENIAENGQIRNFMGLGLINGVMESIIMVNMIMTANMVLEYMYYKTKELMKDGGRMENNMVQEHLYFLTVIIRHNELLIFRENRLVET